MSVCHHTILMNTSKDYGEWLRRAENNGASNVKYAPILGHDAPNFILERHSDAPISRES